MIKIKKRDILVFVKAIENVPEGVQFDAETALSLIKNKNALKTEYEALQLQNRPVPGFVEYHQNAQKIQMKHNNNSEELSKALNELVAKYESQIDLEIKRREEFEAQLDKEVEIDLQPINAKKFSGNGKDLLNFLSAIQPVLIFSSEEAK
jgi:hypothetical protein